MMETKGMTNALSLVFSQFVWHLVNMSVTGVYYCFLLHLARVSVLDDGGALPVNDTNSNSNNKYY